MPRLRRIEPVLRRALRGPCRVPADARILVGVSGGADSTALLLGLHRIAHEFGFGLSAAHLHHGLRGRDADGDLEFVRALCSTLGVPLVAATWDTKRRMKRRGLAGQDGLRTLRRDFLEAAARRTRASAIATAHTADDQLETLLMRLGRGTGLAGLAGMPPRRGQWIKPLLEASRADVESDLLRAGQSWREDRSNAEPMYLRNRIRGEAIPALIRALGWNPADPRSRAVLARRAARVSREVRDARGELSRRTRVPAAGSGSAGAGGPTGRPGREQLVLDSTRIATLGPAARTVLWLDLWRRIGPAGVGLTRAHLDTLDALVNPGRKSRIVLPGGVVATRERNQVRLGSISLREAVELEVRSGAADPTERPNRPRRATREPRT